MVSGKYGLSLVGLILLVCSQPTFAGSYSDPSGFSFSHPDGWFPVNRAAMQDVKSRLPEELKTWISQNKVDLSRVAVVLVRNGRDKFLENLNVVVEGQQLPVDEATAAKLTDMLSQRYREMGMTLENLRGRVEKVGPRDAVVVEYQTKMPGVPDVLRQKQVFFPGKGKTYIVTCTAKAKTYGTHQPVFDRIFASFQVPAPNPAPAARGFDWSQVAIKGLVGGAVGGAAGAAIWLTKRFTGKTKPQQRGGKSPPPRDPTNDDD